MQRTYDVLVVGGGVNGCSIAYQLAKRNYKVAIVERARVGSEASSAAAGMLGAQVEFTEENAFFHFACESRNMFEDLVPELEKVSGVSVSYVKNGMLKLARSEEEAIRLKKVARLQSKAGQKVEWLEHENIMQKEPDLGGEVEGAMLVPEDGQVMATHLTKAFARSAVVEGADLMEFTPVRQLLYKHGEVKGVSTLSGDFYADQVIIASGFLSADVLPTDIELPPLTPVKGECITVRPSRQVIRSTIHTKDIYLVPKPDGHIIIGATELQGSVDKKVRMESVRFLMEKACHLIPELKQAELESMWAGVRPQSVDGVPYIGAHSDVNGLWIATGHYRNGILLSPLTGKWIADLIEGGDTNPEWKDAFYPGRHYKRKEKV